MKINKDMNKCLSFWKDGRDMENSANINYRNSFEHNANLTILNTTY